VVVCWFGGDTAAGHRQMFLNEAAALPTRSNRIYIAAMPARKPRPPDEKPQIERFREMARELECDEDEAAFDAKLAQLLRYRGKVAPRKGPKREPPKT
jgi:hypothetical protein